MVLNMIKSTGKPFVNYVPKEVAGTVPLKGIIAPIYDDSEMIGLFSVSISTDKEEKVSSTSKDLTESVEQAVESIKSGNESIAHIKKIAK